MTVIAWDGITLAADRRGVMSGLPTLTNKIHLITANIVFAGCGDRYQALAAVDYLKKFYSKTDRATLIPPTGLDDFCGLIVEAVPLNHSVHFNTRVIQSQMVEAPLLEKQIAFGSGRDFALAAMHLNQPAFDAVEIATKFDNCCGNGVSTAYFERLVWSIHNHDE